MTVSRIDFSVLDFLLIEENNFVRDLVCAMLRGFGVTRLREARSIEAAMADMERHPPDIILCDWMMKPTDGLLFLRRLRAERAKPHAHALVIMISEHASSDHVEAALGEGADSYIVKPFRPATLLTHLVQIITGQQVRLVD
jgi:two-component system chemotaxis response regulator CheY